MSDEIWLVRLYYTLSCTAIAFVILFYTSHSEGKCTFNHSNDPSHEVRSLYLSLLHLATNNETSPEKLAVEPGQTAFN
jgi:hypothetical protein